MKSQNLDELNRDQLQSLIYAADEIITGLVDVLETFPTCIQDIVGEEVWEKLEQW